TETPNNQRKYGVWGYGDNGSGQFLPFGNDTNVQGTVLERETLSAIVQFRPNDSIDVVVDYLDIDYADSGMLRGFIEPFSFANVEGSGYDVTGDQINANPVLRTDPINKEGELQTIGLNVKWNATDNLSVMFDYADSEADKFDQRAESYAGLARSGTLDSSQLNGTRSFQMSENGIFFTGQSGLEAFSDPSMLQLTGPQVWGGGMASIADQFETGVLQANGEPFSYLNAQDGFNNFATFHEELTTTRLELEYSFDDGVVTSVIVGGNYSDRYKDKVNTGQFVTTTAYPLSASIPSDYVVGLADLTWAGLGRVVAYDGNAPYNDGTYVRNDAGALEPDRL
ncbi:MAG: TonB-dependent receptor, partial [Halieaceae bacterium]